ncbi:MAG: sulfide/dihydroorotate dehydrogenase-like FAD/NAD-binding protein [Acholeplasma sp.]|jgi:ferredoxin--NADP+ reductase|nr:MAG: sulfide/dihydroorotate dehydrogenase-like FAD/NAD-binding protein [Acholeplasma sp.]
MFFIREKRRLAPTVFAMEIEAPLVIKHAEPGHFVMIRVDEDGERIPLTIADINHAHQTLTIIVQVVGATTYQLSKKNMGDTIADCLGPCGKKTELEGIKRAILIGGGVGCAILHPIAKKLSSMHAEILTIIGFRNQSLVILEDEFYSLSNRLLTMTDDGSYGEKGFVTEALKNVLKNDRNFDCIIAIGPIPMMKAVSEETRPYGIKTIVSMNPIMVDGTGMCGGCRIQVDGEMKFACVDGPDFDGHKVDFDGLMKRNKAYTSFEKNRYEAILSKEDELHD